MVWKKEDRYRKRERFDQSSAYYGSFLSGYPDGLIDKVLEYSKVNVDSKILEIGAGRGKETEQFVQRGLPIVCVERGSALAEEGMRKFRNTSLVNYQVGRFQGMSFEAESIDLIFSAQAFHWIEKSLVYSLMKNSMKSGASAALFSNKNLDDGSDMSREIKAICSKYGVLHIETEEEIFSMCENNIKEVKGTKYFDNLELYSQSWEEKQTIDDFINFLRTGKSYMALDENAMQSLESELEIVFTNYGNMFMRKYVSIVYLFKKI